MRVVARMEALARDPSSAQTSPSHRRGEACRSDFASGRASCRVAIFVALDGVRLGIKGAHVLDKRRDRGRLFYGLRSMAWISAGRSAIVNPEPAQTNPRRRGDAWRGRLVGMADGQVNGAIT